MSTTIDERVVEMKFDNRNFESNAQTSLSTIEKLKKNLNFTGAAKGLESIGDAAKNVNMSGIGSAVDTVKVKFSALEVMAVTALMNITNSAINSGKRIASALTIDPIKTGFQEYETQINAIQTILANTESKGSTLKDVNNALAELNKYADQTIYNFTEMTRNIGTFTAAGVDLDNSVSAIKGIANLAAVSGSTSQQASTAMYQLSQALASGTVKLMDWNSVVNAGMGGQVFQDALKETARVHGISIDSMIKDEGSFRETLSKGWLTSEILTETLNKFTGDLNENQLKTMGYTDEQIKSIIKMGQTANDAATKVKTFTQLFDTLKEAAQSGWTQSWEIIVGDFEEAKSLLTEASDIFGGLIGQSAEARNSVLQGWKDLGGRTALLDAVRNSFVAIGSVITPIKEAFRDIFPPITAKNLADISEALKKFTSNLKLTDTASENLKRTFKGVFAIVDIGRQAFVAIFNAITPLFGGLDDLGGGILEVTASWGDWVVKLNETIKTTDVFNETIQNVIKFVKDARDKVVDFVTTVTAKFDFPGFELLHSFLERIYDKLSQVNGVFDFFKIVTLGAIKVIGEAFSNSNILEGLQTIGGAVSKAITGILTAMGSLGRGLLDAVSDADFDNVFDLINTASLGGIAFAVSKFFKNLSKPLEGFQGILNGVTGILDGVRGSLEAFQSQLKAGTLLKIASAVAILAAAIVAISLIDSNKLTASLAAITVLFTDLMVSMTIFGKISGKLSGVGKATGIMIGMSLAILLLASALKKIGSLELEEMITGVIGVAGLVAIMVTAMKSFSSSSSTIIKGSVQMVIFAGALKILASACEDLSALSWEELGKGLLGLGGLLLQLSLFLNFTEFSGKSITTATGIVILAAAMKILASACEDFGNMDWVEIQKGLVSIGILLAEIAIFTRLTGNAKHVISTGVALIAISTGIKILASAIKDLGGMDIEDLKQGLLGMGIALVAISMSTKMMPTNMAIIGVGLIAVSTALVILANAIKSMGGMTWEEIGRGMTVLGGSMAILAIGLNIMNGTLAGSAALLVAVGALTLLVPVLSILGAMSWESIVKGLVALAGAFTVIGIAGLVLTPIVPTILALGGAFALIGIGILGIGAGLLAAGAGLSALAVGFAALAVSVTGGAAAIAGAITVIVGGIAGLIPDIVAKLGEGIVEFVKVIGDSAEVIGEAFVKILLSLIDVFVECIPELADGLLKMIVGVLEAMVEYIPTIVGLFYDLIIEIIQSLADKMPDLVGAAVDLLMAFFSGITEALNGIDMEVLLQGIVGIGLLAAIMTALAGVAALVPGAMLGVLGLGLVIAEMALVLAAVGAFAQIPGLSWLIGEGSKLLGQIGDAIGSFIGGIIGGLLGGITSSFPGMGTDLSNFMDNLQPFINGAKKIDEKVTAGVKGLAETVLILTAANVLKGLTSWLTGGASIVDFGKELAEFGPYFSQYYNSIKSIDGAVVVASSNAAKALAEMAKELPNSGGVAGWFAGENSLSTFAEELAVFGPAIKRYADSVTGLDANVVVNSANAAKALSELAANLPNSGGLVSWFTGDNDIATFGEQLVSFGKSFNSYYESVSAINTSQLSGVVSEFKRIVEFATGVEKLDTSALGAFGTNLTILGQTGIDGFISAFTNASDRVLTAGSNMVTSIINGVKSKQAQLTETFENIFRTILTNINNKQPLYFTAGQMLMVKLIAGTKTKEGEIKTTYNSIITECLNAIKNKFTEFNNVGLETMVNFISGVKSKIGDVKQAFVDNANSGLSGMNSLYSSFYASGSHLVDGFANGISDNKYKAEARAKEMARAAANAARKELDEHSPSRIGYSIGDFFGIAFVNGIGENVAKARKMSTNMASAAKKGLSKGILKLKNLLDGEFDTNPVITPVLDLTNFKAGVLEMREYMGHLNAEVIGNTANRASAVIATPSKTLPVDSSLSNVEEFKNIAKAISQNGSGSINNQFYITSNNPKEVADEVSKRIQNQVERRVVARGTNSV